MTTTSPQQQTTQEPSRDEGFERLRREQHDPARVARRDSAERRPR